MKTSLIYSELQKFNMPDAKISEMRNDYMPLKINGVHDKQGYQTVKAARLCVKSARVNIELIRKSLKEDSLSYGRAVDAEAKRITSLLLPIEHHLEIQESAIDEEKEKIRREQENARAAKLQSRVLALQAVNANFLEFPPVITMSDQEFESILALETTKYEYEKKRLVELETEKIRAAEEENKKIEEGLIEKQRLEAIAEQERKIKEEEVIRQEERLSVIAEQQKLEAIRLAEERAQIEAKSDALQREVFLAPEAIQFPCKQYENSEFKRFFEELETVHLNTYVKFVCNTEDGKKAVIVISDFFEETTKFHEITVYKDCIRKIEELSEIK